MATPNGRSEVVQMFGNPARSDGSLNTSWRDANIQVVRPPEGWRLYYQDGANVVPVSGISMHRSVANSFREVLTDIWNYARLQVKIRDGYDKTTTYYNQKTRELLHELRMDLHGGGFEYRPVTGGSGLSMHSYGIAIDWDPVHNPRRRPLTRTLPDWWYDIWAAHGWTDGRHYGTPDPMHVQYASGV